MGLQLTPVARAHTPFKEKFAIPRQPILASAAQARIELLPPFNDPIAFSGLEGVSHIWLLFHFHVAKKRSNPLRVRPPRLGGNEKMGVFASRSTHRPNGLGQSVVKLEKILGTELIVSGIDLLDGTPIVDIKPYLPYADSIPEATHVLAAKEPELIPVSWSKEARMQADYYSQAMKQNVTLLIEQCLSQNPKPAYQSPNKNRHYGTRLWDLAVTWHYPDTDSIRVLNVEAVTEKECP